MSKKQLNIDPVLNELRGQSVFFDRPEIRRGGKSNGDKPPDNQTSAVPNSRTSQVTNFPSSELTDIRTYELRNFTNLWRLDIRLTGEQKRFLSDLEDKIRADMPEGEANNPDSKRITKNSIVRVFVEIFRQLNLNFDASRFMNENDLLKALYKSLQDKLTNFRTSEVTE